MSILITSDAYNKVITGLQFAMKGKTMGMDVNVFFMSCGMKAIKKNAKLHYPGILAPFTFIAKKRMKKAGIDELNNLMEKANQNGVNFYACNTCISIVGIKEKDVKDFIELTGIDKYIEFAQTSDVQLTMN